MPVAAGKHRNPPARLKPAARRQERISARKSAEERREEVVRAAVAVFAEYGLHGTSTEQIAKRVKISQPYVFRLFPTKKDLFLAAIDSCFDRVEAAFRLAANNPGPFDLDPTQHHQESGLMAHPRLHAMGHAYAGLLGQRELLLFQMQAYAAGSDDQVRRRVRQRWEQLTNVVSDLSGASRPDIVAFFAKGMLMNVVVSIGMVPPKEGKGWAHEALGFA